MVPMQVGFLRIYKMKLSSYDNNFQFVVLVHKYRLADILAILLMTSV